MELVDSRRPFGDIFSLGCLRGPCESLLVLYGTELISGES